MNKDTQLTIGTLLGFEKNHQIYDGIEWDSHTAGDLTKEKEFTKEDLFSITPNGKSFFEYRETWMNLKKLFEFMKDKNQKINIQDFKKNLGNNRTAMEMGTNYDEFVELFIPEIWVGHSDEMEDTWYYIDKTKRLRKDFDEIKSAVAKLEGRETREDQLKKMDITSTEMHNAVRNGDINHIQNKLKKHGDHLRLEDAQLCDRDGDHALYTESGWDSFAELNKKWKEHGEIPDTKFFLFKRGGRLSIVEFAFKREAEKMVFNSNVFADRPEEALKLYDNLSKTHQEKIDIDVLLSSIVEKSCSEKLEINEDFSIETLTSVLYQFEESVKDRQPIVALGLKKIWDNIDQIHGLLKEQNETVTLDNLRMNYGLGGETCLMRAANFGHFEKVMEFLAETNEVLELSDFLNKRKDGKNLLDVLVKNDQIEALLQPEYWVGHASDLCTIWGQLPDHMQDKLKEDFQAAQTQANILSLHALKESHPSLPAPIMAP